MALRKSAHDYAKARKLRKNLTLPEGLLWKELRNRQSGYKFRRQHPVGAFVIDFYCAQTKLGIEVDGIAHDMGERPDRDAQRDQFLREQGIQITRFAATEILKSAVDVAEAIVALCKQRCT